MLCYYSSVNLSSLLLTLTHHGLRQPLYSLVLWDVFIFLFRYGEHARVLFLYIAASTLPIAFPVPFEIPSAVLDIDSGALHLLGKLCTTEQLLPETSVAWFFCLFHCVAPAAWNSEIYLPHLPECWDSKYMLLSLASRVVIPSAALTICSHLPRSAKSNISGQDEKRGVSVVSPMRQRKWVTHSSIMECLKGGFSFCLKEILAGMLAKYFPTQGALVNCSIHVQLQWSFIAYFPWARG